VVLNREILVIGDYYVDHIFTGAERWPAPGQEVFARTLESVPGGAFTHARALHRLDVTTAWAADLGNDELSDTIRRAAEAEGLSPSAFLEYEHPRRRLTVAVTHEGDRGFISYRDTVERPDFPSVIRNRRPGYLLTVELAVSETWRQIAEACKEVGARILLDPQHNDLTVDNVELVETLASVEVFLPNVEEAIAMTGQPDAAAAAIVLGTYVPVVVVKDGSRGAFLHHDRNTVHVSAPIAPDVVDTVGAGDCFDAGFAAAFAHGLSLRACTELAVICGSISVGGSGGSTAPRASELAFAYPHLVPWATHVRGASE
jgi:sugar/nucleoside kinase (ribokinase family)